MDNISIIDIILIFQKKATNFNMDFDITYMF